MFGGGSGANAFTETIYRLFGVISFVGVICVIIFSCILIISNLNFRDKQLMFIQYLNVPSDLLVCGNFNL